MSRLSFEKRRAQQPVAHPAVVHVRVSGEGGASVGGTALAAAEGEDIQQTVLNHLQRLAISLGAPIRATIHDDRAGCVVPLEVFTDGSSRMAGDPVRVAPGASTAGTGLTQEPTGRFGPPPVMATGAPRATTEPKPAPTAGARPETPGTTPGSWPEPATDSWREPGPAAEPAPAAAPRPQPGARPGTPGTAAASRPEAATDSRPGAATGSWPEPAGGSRPAPAAASWPEPAADPRPVAAAESRYQSAVPSRPAPELRRMPEAAPVPAPLLDPAPVPAGSATPTPARGFDAVAEEVLGDEPVTETAEGAELLAGPLARINEAVRDGRIEAAAELADRTVTEAAGVLGPHHPEVLHLGELTAYIAYLAGDPVRSFRRCLDLARLRRRAGDAEAAYGNVRSAATAWRAVRDPQEGLRLGRELIELWTELEAEPGPAAEDPDPLRSARARMVRLTDRAARAERA
ncbi:tetratricopeptide repeat protein [Streptomyces collinus]|uniref:tetratricopeptide repeat protein n=1 Tax=Streptomyces collinus TaxID=42684 RepID=UPI00340A54A8